MSSTTRTTRSAARGRPRQMGAAATSPGTTSAPRSAPTVVAPPEPRPDWASATLVPSTTRFEDLPCVTQGSLGAGTVCEASRVWTADGTACDAGSPTQLVFRLNALVTTLPPAPGMPNFLDVLRQAEEIRNATDGSSAFRNRLAFSGIAEYAVRISLASGLLTQSNGCVVLPAPEGLTGFTAAAVDSGTMQQGVVAGEAALELRGDGVAQEGEQLPSTIGEASVSAAEEEPASVSKSNPSSKDNADFVDLLTSPHARHEVRKAVLGHMIYRG